jgi:hypothetical protein
MESVQVNKHTHYLQLVLLTLSLKKPNNGIFWCCGKTRTPIPCLNLPCSFFYFYKEIITLFKFNLSFYLFNNHDRTHLKCTSKSVWVLSEFSWRYKKISRFNKNKILRTTIWQSWKFFSNFFQIPSSII